MKKVETRLLKGRDEKIMKWLGVIKKENLNPSPYIVLAIEYYIRNENFLCVGKVKDSADTDEQGKIPEKTRLQIYIPGESDVIKWANEQIELKKGLLPLKIRYILSESIGISEKNDIPSLAELTMLLNRSIKGNNIGNDTAISQPINSLKEAVVNNADITTESESENISKGKISNSDAVVNNSLRNYFTDDDTDDEDENISYEERSLNRGKELLHQMLPKPDDF